jgi:2-haloacid dehalogenase
MAVRLNVKAIAFDLYGTLVDVSAIGERCKEVATDGDGFCATWRAKQLEYAFLTSLMGRYRDFMDLTERALDYTASRFGVALDAEQRKRLLDGWLAPTVYSEVPSMLGKLADRYALAILSNGAPRMLESGLKATEIRSHFRWVLSAHSVKVYKPSPRIYQLAVQKTRLAKNRILFVSSNSFDVLGAKNFGFKVCWLNRSSAQLDPLGAQPDLTVSDLSELGRALGLDSV